ncbi:Fanconi anemia group B protein [Clupea harengus]|uniref:Fanconi anemia group B protein n=1 Tax=Clupea harengus TaxID=7950 RepID=A0A6P8F061_CLUHA|nr:Fanconi anemia group B protein [Clupea harengus]XP_031416522.1 Fanconi anemia group B protein [Clupea harengus]XP_031416534.1 Fanconi anemia group B protein [Clupea harengus]
MELLFAILSLVMTQEKQCTKLITLNGDILSFQCRYSHQDGDSRKKSDLRCRRLAFTKETNSFSSQNGDMLPIYEDISADVDVVCCSTALDVRKKIVVPCILLKQWKRKTSCYKYKLITLTSPTKAELHVKFDSLYELRDGVTIFQGPTVVWRHENTVHYASAHTSEVRSIPLQMSVVFLGELCSKVIVLGSQIHSKEEVNHQIRVNEGNKMVGYSVEDGKVFNGTCIIPNAYSSVVQCACVISAEEVKGNMKVTMVAATSKQQLVCFEDGFLTEVCQLPFEEPECIKMANIGNSGLIFAVSFNHGNVCAVWRDTFQVAACWSGVSSVLVDDFVGCGTDQILLVLHDQNPSESITNFIMTDLCGIMYSHGHGEIIEKSETSEAAQGNYLCTIQALESRLQSGLTLLQDLQRDGDVKDRVLLQSTDALADMMAGREHIVSKTEEEGLVSLWEDADEGEEGVQEEKLQTEQEPLLVEKLWQRVIEDRLVVGVLLTKEAAILLESATISIEMDTAHGLVPTVIQTQSRAHWLPTTHPPSPPEPLAKRKRPIQAGGSSCKGGGGMQRLALTAVCELTPLLTCGHVKCPVMLHYVLKEVSPAPGRPPGPKALQCGWVTLSLPDVAQGVDHPRLLRGSTRDSRDDSREDLLCLLAFLDTWSFQIYSPDHTVYDVGQWLQEALGCETVERSPQYLLLNPAGASAALVFHWQQKSPFLGELVVYCRGRLALLKFLHSLCGFLPASYHIQPLRKGGSEHQAQDVARSLEGELLALREGLSSLLSDAADGQEDWRRRRSSEEAGGGGAPGLAAGDELQRRREEWKRVVEGRRRGVGPLVVVDRYQSLVQRVLQVQLQVDVDVLLGQESRSVFTH